MGLPVPEQDTARMLLLGGRRLESAYQDRIRILSLISSWLSSWLCHNELSRRFGALGRPLAISDLQLPPLVDGMSELSCYVCLM